MSLSCPHHSSSAERSPSMCFIRVTGAVILLAVVCRAAVVTERFAHPVGESPKPAFPAAHRGRGDSSKPMGLPAEDEPVQSDDQLHRPLHELHGPWRDGESHVESSSAAGLETQISNIQGSEKFRSPLPSRVLQESDSLPNISDLSTEENHMLSTLNWMSSANQLLALVNLWRSAMCSSQTREKGQALLHDLVLDPKFPGSSLMSVLSEMFTSC